jgi:hypothetical protein
LKELPHLGISNFLRQKDSYCLDKKRCSNLYENENIRVNDCKAVPGNSQTER